MEPATDALANLIRERDRLAAELAHVEGAIAALRKAMEGSPAVEVQAAPAPARPELLPPPPQPAMFSGPYAGLDFYQAAAVYLAAAGEPKTSREIADALKAGGYFTIASNFRASVRTMLNRHLSARPAGIHRAEDGERWYFRDPNPAATS